MRDATAARALLHELSSDGFDCRIPKKGNVGLGPKSEPLVVVDVEARPEGPQGDAKLRSEAKKSSRQATPKLPLHESVDAKQHDQAVLPLLRCLIAPSVCHRSTSRLLDDQFNGRR